MPTSFVSAVAKQQSDSPRNAAIINVLRNSPVVMVVFGLAVIMMILGAVATIAVFIYTLGEKILERFSAQKSETPCRIKLAEHQMEFLKLVAEYKQKGTIGGYPRLVEVDLVIPDDEEYFSAPEPEIFHAVGRDYLGAVGKDGEPTWIPVL
jgi:hypothetical protein